MSWDYLGPILGGLVGLVPTMVTQLLRVLDSRRKSEAENEQLERAHELSQRKSTFDEMSSVIAMLRQDRDSDRELIHDLRTDVQQMSNRLAVCEANRAEQDKKLAEQDKRIAAMENHR